MSTTDLKRFLQTTGMTVVQLAVAANVHPQTVYRFLKGKRVHPATLTCLQSFVSKFSESERKVAVG
jgi:predicted transcriptional regulator